MDSKNKRVQTMKSKKESRQTVDKIYDDTRKVVDKTWMTTEQGREMTKKMEGAHIRNGLENAD